MKQLLNVTFEREAAAKAVEAALSSFESACWRNRPDALVQATEQVHAAIQAQLDAVASQIAVTKQVVGRS